MANKLYTKEQVKKVWKAGQEYWKTSGASVTLEELLEQEKSIELPSDEEIDAHAHKVHDDLFNEFYAYTDGAKWMKEQILNQIK